ncbi:MAG: hypothetical protein AB1458_11270 [Bacteroidota bacterium]
MANKSFTSFFFLLLPAFYHAQVVDTGMWITNGPVNAMVHQGNNLYIGGSFDDVGPSTGHGVPLDTLTGNPVYPYPKVDGTVYAVIADTNGGWYIGGTFDYVGNVAQKNLAHILPNGQVDMQFTPNINGAVRCLFLKDSSTTFQAKGRLYIGGDFTSVGNNSLPYAAEIDPVTGMPVLHPDNQIGHYWRPDPDSAVHDITVSSGGSHVYLCGAFTFIGGAQRNYLGKGRYLLWLCAGLPDEHQREF